MTVARDGVEVTLTSDEVFALALTAAARHDLTNQFAASLVVELIRAAINLKTVELHMQIAHGSSAKNDPFADLLSH